MSQSSKSKERNYSRSQATGSTKGEKTRSNQQKSFTQGDTINEDFEEVLMNISLKKPKNAYNIFISEMNSKAKNKANITETTKEFSKKWHELSDKEKAKYEKKADEDFQRYQEHLDLVKKNILEKPKKENTTAYKIFLEEVALKAREDGKDVKEAKEQAREEWKEMDEKDRLYYDEQRDKILELYEDLRKSAPRNVSAYALFCRDQMAKGRQNNEKLTLVECSEKWKNAKDSTKEKYEQYADEEREERSKKRDLYEIAFGIKPRRPIGAYKFFMIEMAREGRFDGKSPFVECKKLWAQTSDEKREKYLRMAKKEQLAYTLKKMEYNSQVRKTNSNARPLSAFNLFLQDLAGKVKDPEGGMMNYAYGKWRKAEEATKKKYEKRAEEEKVNAEKRRAEFRDRVHDAPKRPVTPYAMFIKDKTPEVRKKYPDEPQSEVFKKISEEWKKTKESEKEKYYKAFKKEQEAYYDKVDFYNENSYYLENAPKGKTNTKREQSEDRKSTKGKSKEKSREKSRERSSDRRRSSSEDKERTGGKKGKQSTKGRN